LTATGQVTATDVDHDAVLSYSVNTTTGSYGSLVLDSATGAWTYTLTNDQTLSANDSLTDTFPVTVTADEGAHHPQAVTSPDLDTNDRRETGTRTEGEKG